MGTPKTLDHAIYVALCVGPLSQIKDRAYHVMKDFLAQRFGAAMLQHPECKDVLKQLFDKIVERDQTQPQSNNLEGKRGRT